MAPPDPDLLAVRHPGTRDALRVQERQGRRLIVGGVVITVVAVALPVIVRGILAVGIVAVVGALSGVLTAVNGVRARSAVGHLSAVLGTGPWSEVRHYRAAWVQAAPAYRRRGATPMVAVVALDPPSRPEGAPRLLAVEAQPAGGTRLAGQLVAKRHPVLWICPTGDEVALAAPDGAPVALAHPVPPEVMGYLQRDAPHLASDPGGVPPAQDPPLERPGD